MRTHREFSLKCLTLNLVCELINGIKLHYFTHTLFQNYFNLFFPLLQLSNWNVIVTIFVLLKQNMCIDFSNEINILSMNVHRLMRLFSVLLKTILLIIIWKKKTSSDCKILQFFASFCSLFSSSFHSIHMTTTSNQSIDK